MVTFFDSSITIADNTRFISFCLPVFWDTKNKYRCQHMKSNAVHQKRQESICTLLISAKFPQPLQQFIIIHLVSEFSTSPVVLRLMTL